MNSSQDSHTSFVLLLAPFLLLGTTFSSSFRGVERHIGAGRNRVGQVLLAVDTGTPPCVLGNNNDAAAEAGGSLQEDVCYGGERQSPSALVGGAAIDAGGGCEVLPPRVTLAAAQKKARPRSAFAVAPMRSSDGHPHVPVIGAAPSARGRTPSRRWRPSYSRRGAAGCNPLRLSAEAEDEQGGRDAADRRHDDAAADGSSGKSEAATAALGDAEARRTVTASATLDLPFSSQTAFDAFTDFPRQPRWSDWLRSVEYLDDEEEDGDVNRGGDGRPEESSGGGIRPSRWTARLFGLRYSWTSEGTEYVSGSSLGWRSTSGMRTSGRVVFEPSSSPLGSTESDGEGGERCRVTLTMSVRAPRAVAAVFRRSGGLERYFRDKILGGTLAKFRDVVLEEDVRGGDYGGDSGGDVG